MKIPTFIVCLMLGGCASLGEQIRIEFALHESRIGRAQWEKQFAKEIAEVPELKDLP